MWVVVLALSLAGSPANASALSEEGARQLLVDAALLGARSPATHLTVRTLRPLGSHLGHVHLISFGGDAFVVKKLIRPSVALNEGMMSTADVILR
jgi:hypothetical protein